MMRVNLIFTLFLSFSANALDLKKAAVCDGMSENKTEIDLNTAKIIEAVYKQNNIDLSASCLGWTNLGVGGVWFEILSDLKVNGINVPTKQYLGSWPLDASDPCENSENPDCASPWWVGRWGEDEVLEPEIKGNYQSSEMGLNQGLNSDDSIMGCMGKIPLRYGDIDSDGKKELAIFLLNGYSLDFVLFSSEKHKNIFTTKLEFNDVLAHESIFVEDGSMNEMLPNESLPYYQYWSRTGVDSGSNFSMSQGYRGFGKLYIGNFESAQSSDLLVWRKVFKSRLLTDAVKGFEKVSDTYVHYKLINGEYKKQDTKPAVVKGWLTAKNLTWKKGYPSISECLGQEGQFIAEMHDPLLNDPDVLQ